jgi:hypothetical protein
MKKEREDRPYFDENNVASDFYKIFFELDNCKRAMVKRRLLCNVKHN